MPGVRRGGQGDVEAVSAMLSRAFMVDPVARYIFPDDAQRAEKMPRFFSLELSSTYLTRGELWVEEHGAGAAMWMPPGIRSPGMSGLLMLAPLIALMRSRFLAAQRLALALAARHPRERHYYLGTIGTDPPAQRQGVGAALLAPVLTRCDLEGVPAYLECSSEANLAFYGAHGFEIVGELGDERLPRLWLMWRKPSVVAA